MKEITVEAPATVANVVCGFDCLGFALDKPCDELTVRLIDERVVRIRHLDDFDLPTEPEKNVAGAVLLSMLARIESPTGFEVTIKKGIKPGSGVGSSAACAAGAAYAANALLGSPWTKAELIEFARDGELVACGARIADNVAACLYGGFTLVRATEPAADVVALEFPALFATVIHPQIEIKTSEARALLRAEIPLSTAVRQWGNVGALVAALFRGDYELLARSLVDDVAEPYRKKLIPLFDELKASSIRAGALGGGISGSGPSVFMLAENETTADQVASAMREIYAPTGIAFNIYISPINAHGVVTK